MSFLQPSVLWALLFLSVPIVVHLFNFRRPKRLLFSHLAFVREVNQAVVQRLKLKQWLLLAARLLAVAAIVFLFAEPVILPEGSLPAGVKGGHRSVVVVVDNSLSMEAADAGGEWFQQASFLAREVLNLYQETDEFLVLAGNRPLPNASFQTRGQALESLGQLTPNGGSLQLGNLLQRAEDWFSAATHAERHLYILSDFQASTVLADSLPDSLPGSVQVHALPIGQRIPPNVYVESLALQTAVVQPGEPVALAARISNASDEDLRQIDLQLQLAGREVSIARLEALPAGETREAVLRFTPTESGWLGGQVSLKDPAVVFDNTRYFALHLPDNPKLLVVQGQTPTPQSDVLLQEVLTQFQVVKRSDRELANENLADYPVIVLMGAERLSSGVAARLADWVAGGGGLVVFPGEEVEGLNELFSRLNAGRWTGLRQYETPQQTQKPVLDHPLLAGVLAQDGGANRTFDGPAVTQMQGFTPAVGGVQQVVWALTNGSPLLFDAARGEGRVVSFTVIPSLVWSDFPLKSSFAALMYRALQYVQQQPEVLSFDLAKAPSLTLRAPGSSEVQLLDEAGLKLLPPQRTIAGRVRLSFRPMNLKPGVYAIQQQDSLLAKVAFNHAAAESQLTTITADELASHFEAAGLEIAVTTGEAGQVRQAVQQAGLGTALWRWFLVLALLALTAEVLIQKFMRP